MTKKKANPKKGGRPRKYTDLEVFQKKIDEYFELCKTLKILPEVTELAVALGFTSRQQVLDYEGRPEFSDAVKKAKLMIECAWARRLTEPYPTGAIFYLKNNAKWRDLQDVNLGNQDGEPILGNLELATRVLSLLELTRIREEEAKVKALPAPPANPQQ